MRQNKQDKKQHLLDVWFNKIKSENKFCVETTIESTDEWLHSFYYFNDEIPTDTDFEKTVGDYLSFKFLIVMQHREYLFSPATKEKSKKCKLPAIASLEEKEWGEFFIGGDEGVFSIAASKSGIDKNKLEDNGEKKLIPYITRTEDSNGISHFITEKQNEKYRIDNGNVITIGLDTQTVFYQPYKFYTGQNIQVLSVEQLNKYNALFVIPLIKVQMKKFSWGGNGATLGRLFSTKIMFPINEKKEPDWKYMESYITKVISQKLSQYLRFTDS